MTRLRVWHIPQVPGKAFHVEVKDLEQAKLTLQTLWAYDTFQFDENIKPDYSNASGLEVFKNDEWLEWEDEEGQSVDEVMDSEAA